MGKTIEITKYLDIDIEVDVCIDYVRCDGCGKMLDFKIKASVISELEISVSRHDCTEIDKPE